MNKTTKGSLAAGAAAVLLLGGAGSLAYWTSDATASLGSITAGELAITPAAPCTGWTYSTGAAGAPKAVTKYVPGDKITNVCTFTVKAAGDNLKASISTTSPTFTAVSGKTLALEPTTAFVITGPNGRAISDTGFITAQDGGQTITATINVNIPYGTKTGSGASIPANENDMQGLTTALGNVSVSLVQLAPTA